MLLRFSLLAFFMAASAATVSAQTITIISGNNQVKPRLTQVNGSVAVAKFSPISVQLRDASGKPLAGQSVNFMIPATSTDVQIDPGGANNLSVVTNASGIATLNAMDGNAAYGYYHDGPFTITARYLGASATIGQTIGGNYESPFVVTIVSGDKQLAARNGDVSAFTPLQVRVTNRSGTPVSGVPVGFMAGDAPEGMVVQVNPTGQKAAVITTNKQGLATLNVMNGHGAESFHGAGTFTLLAFTEGSRPATFTLSAGERTALPIASSQNAVKHTEQVVTVPSGTPVMTKNGMAIEAGASSQQPVTSIVQQSSPQQTAAVYSMSIISGNNQFALRSGANPAQSMTSFEPLVVQLLNSNGTPAAGVPVEFSEGRLPAAMSVKLDPAGRRNASVITDRNGYASLNLLNGRSLQSAYADGFFSVNAMAGGAMATFNLLVTGPEGSAPAERVARYYEPSAGSVSPSTTEPDGSAVSASQMTLTVIAGNNQISPRLLRVDGSTPQAKFGPVAVQLRDAAGNPLTGRTVTFSLPVSNTDVQIDPNGTSTVSVTTDRNGVARLDKMNGNSAYGMYRDKSFAIIARAGDASTTIYETIGGKFQSPYRVSIVGGNNQFATREGSAVSGGTAAFSPLQVRVTGLDGEPAAGVPVGFMTGTVPSGMVVQVNPTGQKTSVVKTNSSGIATLNLMDGSAVHSFYSGGVFNIVAFTDGGEPITFNMAVVK